MSETRPDLLLLDVNETLSDLAPMGEVFAAVGLAPEQARLWFATVLRDGFALTAAGSSATFADIGRAVAADLLREAGADPAGAAHVLEAFTSLDVHPDVPTGLAALAAGGTRLVTLSNGAASVAEGLLERAGVASAVEACLSVEEAGVWKPAARSYGWALERLGVAPDRAALAAVHPWDVHGARAAGFAGVLVDRAGRGTPAHLGTPSLVVTDLDDLARRWA